MTNPRYHSAQDIARSGGALALEYYAKLSSLEIEDKGPQDFVTMADKGVETHIRALIETAYPEDGIVGEEHAPKPSQSGYTWVIDPIDGTANFIASIPQWCVIVAVVKEDQTEIGVTFDPIHDEMFSAKRGSGAQLNGAPLMCPPDTSLKRGSVSTAQAPQANPDTALGVVTAITQAGGVFHRNASGGLSLAYVAAGRLIGFMEEHMNPWDCLAGQLLIAEAGGVVEPQSADAMVANGGRVVAASAGVFEDLQKIADASFR